MLYQTPQDDRPTNAKKCNSISNCDKWRQDIIKEIGDKVSEIQNAGLGEFRIRALNDEINHLLKEKREWDRRIKELGGPDYSKLEKKLYDHDGIELPGSGGYKYIGAAKDLPGVRELFYRDPPAAPKRNLNELYKLVDSEYYGASDVEDRKLREEEAKLEEREVTFNYFKMLLSIFLILIGQGNYAELDQRQFQGAEIEDPKYREDELRRDDFCSQTQRHLQS